MCKYTTTCNSKAYDVDWHLRGQLNDLTGDESTDVNVRVKAIHALAVERKRHIHVKEYGNPEAVSKYIRCVAYSFHLTPHLAEMEELDICPNDGYVHYLIEKQGIVMRGTLADASAGDHVVYLTSDFGYQHVGIWREGYVWSKWGRLPVFEHGIWDTPERFGKNVRIYSAIDEDQAWALFLEWIKE
jgi:hypothetical protein